MHAEIHAAYQEIRRIYFPRWDRSRSWDLRICEELPCFGCCNRDEKIITIRPIPAGDGLRLLLIHEICHCCAGCGHGPKWRRRMRLAAAAARKKGMGDLEKLLVDEAAAAGAQCATVLAGSVYAAVKNSAAEFPSADFEEIHARVCHRLGLCMDEFEKTYRKARKVFEKISQEVKILSPCGSGQGARKKAIWVDIPPHR